MRVFRRRQDRASPEVKTPNVVKEHVFKSHPLDIDSDSEASYTSTLDNQGDFSNHPDVQKEPPVSPYHTAHKMNQQASSQRADFIASSTPTSLSKAHKMANSMQSLAHEAALAAANRAGSVSRNIEAAANTSLTHTSGAKQHKGSVLYQRPPSVSTSKKTVGSLADITNVMHEQPTNNITKGLLQTTSSDDKDVQQSIKQAAAKSTAGAKSYSAGAFDWTVSTLYYSAGVAAAVREGIARGLHASTKGTWLP